VILLDTDVVFELTRSQPDPTVVAYLRRQPQATLFTSSVCEAEIRYGLARLPAGRRRNELANRVMIFFSGFATRILAFDSAAAELYGVIRTKREAVGRPISVADAMIAATARAYSLAIATCNGGDFFGCAIRVVNPWMKN
jgi:predicted nucleic acid-binding protein